jgi:tetratricopeptide (TPR) repeat protein
MRLRFRRAPGGRVLDSRVCLLLVVLGWSLAGCRSGEPVPPPVATSLEGTDTLVAEQLTELLRAAQDDPRSAQARAALGMAYDVSGRVEGAHASYAQAALLDPEEPRWSYFEAVTLAQLGDLEGALSLMDRVQALDNTYVGAHLFGGMWLLDLGRVDEAGEAYSRATLLAPTAPAAWIGVAKVHLRSDRPSEALLVLNRLLKSSPTNPYLNQLAGQAYRELGDMDKARAALALAKPGDQPLWADPWLNERLKYQTGFGAGMMKAADLLEKGKTAEAAQLLEQLRKERPDDRQLLNNLSVAYRNLSQPDRAFEVLRDGLARHPEYHPFHLNISADYERTGDIDQALWHLGRVIEISPTFVPGWQRIGSIRLAQGKMPEALEAFENAARYKPDSPIYPFYAGAILAEMKRWPESRERLQRSLAINPNQAPALIALGRVEAELGLFVDARAKLDRSKAMAPGDRNLAPAYQRLAQLEASR